MQTKYTGGLTKTSKMPGASFSLPAAACQTGGKLHPLKNSVCHNCYARKGFYRMAGVKRAQADRLVKLQAATVNAAQREAWIAEMAANINATKCKYFRWHDSGDLQSVAHAEMVAEVCRRTPTKRHWLPTKEYRFAAAVDWPENIVVRRSAYIVNMVPGGDGPWNMVYDDGKYLPDNSYRCPAYAQGGKCGDCRACWDPEVRLVALPRH